MIDMLFQITLSNVCISLALAVVAVVLGATLKRPAFAHMLWLLVFVKLLTPPIVTIPVVPIPWQAETAAAARRELARQPDATVARAIGIATNAFVSAETWSAVTGRGKLWLAWTWLLGSAAVLTWSLLQVLRFSRMLGKEAVKGAADLQAVAARIASRLGLSATPTIYTISARIAPMVWCIGGRLWVVIPAALLEQMDAGRLQWILAHELAHVRRRDYMVRWIEWLACVCFWWHPVAWWARRNLRAAEELCCDALVVSGLNPEPRIYGDSLLKAVEILACPAHRLPAVASRINSGGLIERRITMIMSTNPHRSSLRWLQACVLAGALVVIPLGLSFSQDSTQDREAVIAGIRAAVPRGEITAEQGKARLDAYEQKRELEAVAAKIQGAVQNGRITPEQGQAKLADYQKTLEQKAQLEADRATLAEQIRAAVAAGNITPEQGKAKLASYRQKSELEGIVREMRAAVQAGQITEEQAKAKLDAYKMEQKIQSEGWYAAGAEKIRAAIAAGEITPEQGRMKLDALKKGLDAKVQGDPIAGYKADVAKLRAAVADGSLTQEQADAQLADCEKVTIARVVHDLSAAIESGKLSQEDGAAKLTAFLKALEAVKAKR